MTTLKKILLFLIMLTLCGQNSLLYANTEGVTISHFPTSGNLSTRIELQVVLDLNKVSNGVQIKPSSDFELLGQATNSEVSIVNGAISQKSTHIFTLAPLKAGKLRLPDIQVNSKSGTTTIPGSTIDIENSSTDESDSQSEPQSNKLRFQQSVSELEVFQGEQIVNALDAYSPYPINSVDLNTLGFEGFWVEQQGEDKLQRYRQRDQLVYSYSGRRSIYPVQSGILKLPERTAKFSVIEPSSYDSPFDFFSGFPMLGGHQRNINLRTNSLEINVLPIPTGAPASATSWGNTQVLVGKTTLSLNIDNSDIKLGESKTYQLQISSFGNLNPLKKLALTSSKKYKLYEEPVRTNKEIQSGKVLMIAEYNFSIVPLEAGQINIDPIELTYFDPELKSYITLKTEAISFAVSSDEPNVNNAVQPAASHTPNVSSETAPADKYLPESFTERLLDRFSLALIAWLAMALVICILLVYLILYFLRKIRPHKVLRRRLEIANNALDLKTALYAVITFKTGHSVDSYSFKELASFVGSLNIDNKLQFLIQNSLDQLETLCYAPTTGASIAVDNIRDKCLQILESW